MLNRIVSESGMTCEHHIDRCDWPPLSGMMARKRRVRIGARPGAEKRGVGSLERFCATGLSLRVLLFRSSDRGPKRLNSREQPKHSARQIAPAETDANKRLLSGYRENQSHDYSNHHRHDEPNQQKSDYSDNGANALHGKSG